MAISKGARGVVALLRQLLTDRSLTVQSGAPQAGVREAAAREYLTELESKIPYIGSEGLKPVVWSWHWPKEQASSTAALMALAVARTVLANLSESVIGLELTELLKDHIHRYPGADRTTADLSRMFFSRARMSLVPSVEPEAIDLVSKAIIEGRQLEFRYCYFSGKSDEVLVQPYSLVTSDDGLHVVGKCVRSDVVDYVDSVRVYSLARMKLSKRLGVPFVYPTVAEYSPAKLTEYSFGLWMKTDGTPRPEEICLIFNSRWSTFLAYERLHPKQAATKTLPDGRIEVHLELQVSYDFVRWVRGLGNDVDVVKPEQLREWVQSGQGLEFLKRDS